MTARDDDFANTPERNDLTRPFAINWRVVLLIMVLPMFGQTVHYLKDMQPLWGL
mgnify:CR=1 FL=1